MYVPHAHGSSLVFGLRGQFGTFVIKTFWTFFRSYRYMAHWNHLEMKEGWSLYLPSLPHKHTCLFYSFAYLCFGETSWYCGVLTRKSESKTNWWWQSIFLKLVSNQKKFKLSEAGTNAQWVLSSSFASIWIHVLFLILILMVKVMVGTMLVSRWDNRTKRPTLSCDWTSWAFIKSLFCKASLRLLEKNDIFLGDTFACLFLIPIFVVEILS